MPTSREIREEADRLEVEGRAALAEAKRLHRLAGKIERLEAAVVSKRLTSSRDEHSVSRGTLATEIVTEVGKRLRRAPTQASTRLAIGAKNTTRVCLFNDWLAATDQSATSWALDPRHADASGKPRWAPSAVRAWMMDAGKKSARAVPRDAADLIAVESKGAVPAEDSAWPNGISRSRRRDAS
jgi:hypothetical protein